MFGEPVAQQPGEVVEVGRLRGVDAQRLDLAFEDRGDVDVRVGSRPGHQPQLGHDPGFEALALQQFRVREGVARLRVDGPQRRVPDRPVVRVQIRDPLPVDLRTGDDRALRPDLADHPAQIAAQLGARLHEAVPVAEEAHVVHPAELGRVDLLGAAQIGHGLAGQPFVIAAGVAVGHDAVRHAGAVGDPAHHGATDAEFDVVRVGGHDEKTLRRAAVWGLGPELFHAVNPVGRPTGRTRRPRWRIDAMTSTRQTNSWHSPDILVPQN
ncbi:protein of unknown function [Streptomyces murinus]